MYVNRIIEDNWSGVHSNNREYECSSIEQVVTAIQKLNGRNTTSVYLETDEGRHLTVSGGNEGRYIAFVTIGVDDEFYNLLDLSRPEGEMVEVVTGGQTGLFPARHCIRLEIALEAARQFALEGSMSPSLDWQKHS